MEADAQTQPKQIRNLVLLDDDFVIRQVIKIVMANVRKKLGIDIKIYTSGNGVEGLGYIALSKPDILIVDSTLPKYSGRELIEFIASNPKYQTPDIRVIVLSDRKIPMKLPPNHVVLNKEDNDFIKQLTKDCVEALLKNETNTPEAEIHLGWFSNLKLKIQGLTIRLANRADLRMATISGKMLLWRIPSYMIWFLEQLTVSLLIGFSNTFSEKLSDENLAQKRADLARFRVREYPTLATALLTVFFIIFQTVLLVAGGIVVFSVRIESVFADYSPEFRLDLTKTKYDPAEIEYVNSRLQLREIASVSTGSTAGSGTAPSLPNTQVSVPGDGASQGSLLESGLSTKANIQTDIYPYDNPQVIITEGVEYSKLLSIIEDSSANDASSSTKGITEVGLSIPAVAITYQLSPDGQTWWYYNLSEGLWQTTTYGLGQSNIIQQVNHFLPTFDKEIGKTKKLYLKLFLHSDGGTQVSLNGIKVNRELDVVTPVQPSDAQKNGDVPAPASN